MFILDFTVVDKIEQIFALDPKPGDVVVVLLKVPIINVQQFIEPLQKVFPNNAIVVTPKDIFDVALLSTIEIEETIQVLHSVLQMRIIN